MLRRTKKRGVRLSKKKKGERYKNEQLRPSMIKCFGPHQYGPLVLAGPLSIPAKVCKRCTFLLYKDEVFQKNERLRSNRPTTHIDLFWF